MWTQILLKVTLANHIFKSSQRCALSYGHTIPSPPSKPTEIPMLTSSSKMRPVSNPFLKAPLRMRASQVRLTRSWRGQSLGQILSISSLSSRSMLPKYQKSTLTLREISSTSSCDLLSPVKAGPGLSCGLYGSILRVTSHHQWRSRILLDQVGLAAMAATL